jgi:hypothetical protein
MWLLGAPLYTIDGVSVNIKTLPIQTARDFNGYAEAA